MRILFVTRKYPPSTGGMENAAYELYHALAANAQNDVMLIKYGGANKFLPVVYPWLLVRALIAGFKKRPDVIYLQDGLMAPMGSILKLFLRRPTLMTIHGKEATYGNPLYKIMVPPFVKLQNELVAVSNDTKAAVQKAFPGADPLVIINGISDSFYNTASRDENLAKLAQFSGVPFERLQQSKILHTNGRLVRRKGVLWFVDTVLPQLVAADPSALYLVSGEGKDRQVIEAAIADRKMGEYVKLLGRIPQESLNVLYNAADIFLMPNIPVVNDMEGLGLVALEAASCGAMVVASDLEGIPDAIIPGKNGVLVQPGDAKAYLETISRELHQRSLLREAVRNYTLTNCSWTQKAREYEAAMHDLIS